MAERLMTCVFACDVRTFDGNPHHADTPFGRPLVVSDGDLAGNFDRMEARADEATALLEEALAAFNRIAAATSVDWIHKEARCAARLLRRDFLKTEGK